MYEANEIQEVMGRSYGIGDDIDEAELEAEFDALGEHTMLTIHNVIAFLHWFMENSGDDFLVTPLTLIDKIPPLLIFSAGSDLRGHVTRFWVVIGDSQPSATLA